MQGTVEKYRYVRARILRLLAYDNRDSHVGIIAALQVALETIRFTGDEKRLPIF